MKINPYKKTLKLILFVSALAFGGLSGGALSAAEGKQKVVLVDSGKTDYQILIRHEAPSSWALAAKELQLYMKKVGAVEVPIVEEMKPGQKYIVIGSHPSLPAEKRYDATLYKNERFLIDLTAAKHLVIMGGDEKKDPKAGGIENGNFGLLYGTYELIERYLGVHWYAPGALGECFEVKKTIEITGLPFEHTPPYYDRYYWPWVMNEGTIVESREFYLRLRSGGSKSCLPNHTFMHFLKYVKSNPEVFAVMTSGERNLGKFNTETKRWDVVPQICLSNPKTLELFKNDLDDWYSGAPERQKTWLGTENNVTPTDDFIYFCPNDNYSGDICHCAECMKKYDKEANFSGSSSRVVFEFVNKLAAWAEKKYPDKKVAFLAYEGYQDLPKGFTFSKNVVVRLCVNPYLMTWGHPDYKSRIDARLADWKKAISEVSVWQYYVTYDDHPYLTPHIIVDFYRKYQGFLSSVLSQLNNPADDRRPFTKNPELPEGSIPCRDFSRAQLNLIVTQKVLWGTPFDLDEELNRFYKLFYGPAAGPMKVHYDLLIKRWENPPATVKATPASVYGGGYSAEDKYAKIYDVATLKTLTESMDQAMKLVEKGSIYEKRLIWLKTTYFDDFKKKAELFQKESGARFMAVKNEIKNTEVPVLDGKMTEKFWEDKPTYEMYDSGGPIAPRFPTRFKCAIVNETLYIGVQAVDPDVLGLRKNCAKNDEATIFEDDDLELFIAPNASKPEDYYQIAVNFNQNVFDASIKSGKNDSAWSSGIKSANSTDKNAWTMELVLPLKSVGVTDLGEERSIRFNLCRSKRSGTQENSEIQQWAPGNRSFHDYKTFGVLSIYANGSRYENGATYRKNLIRTSYWNTGEDAVKKPADQLLQYLPHTAGARIAIDFQIPKGGTGLGNVCFDRFNDLEINENDYMEVKFRNPSPGMSVEIGYSIEDQQGEIKGDYSRLARDEFSPSWNTKAWKIGSEGYAADKSKNEGNPWKSPVRLKGVQAYFSPIGGISSGTDKREFEIEYIRITKNPLKKILEP